MKYNTKKNNKAKTQSKNNQHIMAMISAAIAIAIAVIFGVCYCYIYGGITKINENINYEEKLLAEVYDVPMTQETESIFLKKMFMDHTDDATEYYNILVSDGINDYNVGYTINPNLFGVNEKDEEVNKGIVFCSFSKRYEIMIESARQHVIKFISDSTVFTDKEMLIEEIKNIPFYLYTEAEYSKLNLDAPAVYLQNAIYCDKNNEEFFCEFMFTHELIHHLRFLTNGKDGKMERYLYMNLDETLTDLITMSMNVKLDYASGYSDYYIPVSRYLSIFKDDALKAYFYGYDDFFKKHGGKSFQIEHDCFAVVVESFTSSADNIIVADAICNSWSAR